MLIHASFIFGLQRVHYLTGAEGATLQCEAKLKPEPPQVNSSAFPQDVHFVIPERNQLRIIVKRAMRRGSNNKKGFTLIELLIVIGIIVALAAVIVPLVIQFAGKGDEGANPTEAATVQTAIDQAMTINSVLTIAAKPVAAVITGADDPTGTGDLLSNYIRDLPTVCSYTWLDSGSVTQDSCP